MSGESHCSRVPLSWNYANSWGAKEMQFLAALTQRSKIVLVIHEQSNGTFKGRV